MTATDNIAMTYKRQSARCRVCTYKVQCVQYNQYNSRSVVMSVIDDFVSGHACCYFEKKHVL